MIDDLWVVIILTLVLLFVPVFFLFLFMILFGYLTYKCYLEKLYIPTALNGIFTVIIVSQLFCILYQYVQRALVLSQELTQFYKSI
jgi:hypothetical protein